MKKEYPLIDLIKLFFAVVVVAVHVFAVYSNVEWFNKTLSVITQVGMAFYFLASGFFVYSKYLKTKNNTVFIKQAIRLLILYMIFNIIYYLIRVLIPGLIGEIDILQETLDYLKNMFIGGTSVMWFIWSLIVINILLYFVTFLAALQKKLAVICASFGLVLYLSLHVIFDFYGSFFLPAVFVSTIKNHWVYFGLLRLFGQGMFFVPFGCLLANFDLKEKKKLFFVLFVIFVFVFAGEFVVTQLFIGRGICFGFSMPPLVFFGFESLILFDKLKPQRNYHICRNLSTAIYLIHTPIMNVAHQVFKHEYIPNFHGIIPFVAVLGLSFVYFVIVYWLKRYKLKTSS